MSRPLPARVLVSARVPARAPFILLAALILFSAPGMGAESTGIPVTVEADGKFEWQSENKAYIAQGNAHATHGDNHVRADKLTALYREREGEKTEIYRLEAEGNVTIVSRQQTVVGDHAVYDIDKASIVMRGDGLRLLTGGRTLSATDRLEYWRDQRRAIAHGDATLTEADRKIRADTLTAHFEPGADGSLAISRMEADGKVVITTPQEVAQGAKGVYTVANGLVVLSGNVTIRRGANQLNGATAEFDLKTGNGRILSGGTGASAGKTGAGTGAGSGTGTGRVKGTFTPRKRDTKTKKPKR